MNRTKQNFAIDIAAFVLFIFLASTGTIMFYALPPGSGHSRSIWGLSRHDWGDIHFWIAAAFLGILVLHLILHWKWIVCLVTGRQREATGRRAALGLVGLLALLAIAFAPLIAPVEESQGGLQKVKTEQQGAMEEQFIRGSMTLREIESTTGVPAEYLIEALELPSGVDRDMKLGQLKQQYGLSMDEVRQVVAQYKP